MRVVLVHQNMPGQFNLLCRALVQRGDQVLFVTQRDDREVPGVYKLPYTVARPINREIHHYLTSFEQAVLNGQAVARVMLALKDKGFVPDLIVGHPGWGETLFVKDIFPDTPLLSYCEYYFHSTDGVLDWDPERPPSLNAQLQSRIDNAHLLLALEAANRGWSPTTWQKTRHPEVFQPKIEVMFDGVDAGRIQPYPDAVFTLPDGRRLSRQDEVLTYAARGLEPYRGFPAFMRALAYLLPKRPNLQVVIAGEDKPYYGGPPAPGQTWRERMRKELSLDWTRVHFVDRLAHSDYVSLLQISRVHTYLTIPFVLSWSFFEAMSAGCLVVASDTPPVREVLRPGENGFLTDLVDPEQIAEDILAALDHPDAEELRRRARLTMIYRYDAEITMPRQLALVDSVAAG